MPVPSSITDLSKIPTDNSPQGTESAKGTIDDYFRAHAAFIRQLFDQLLGPTVILPSATTVNIGFAAASNITITGTTSIYAFDNYAEGSMRWVTFGGALVLRHNQSALILPGSSDITTGAGDVAMFKSLGGNIWRCMTYLRVSGTTPFPATVSRDGYLTAVDWSFFNSKQAAGVCLPLSGGLMTGSPILSNNTGILLKDSGGTTRTLFGFAADNTLNWTIPGGSTWNVYNQSGSTIVWNLDNVGNVRSTGNTFFENTKGIWMKGTDGVARPLVNLGPDNNVNFSIIGGGGFFNFYNQAGTTVVASLSNTGSFSANVITETSDERKKKSWQRVPHDLIERLAKIRKSGLFTWKRGGARGLGVGAQSLEQILPDAVHTDESGAKSVQYGAASMVLVVELARAVVDLRARLAKLEAK